MACRSFFGCEPEQLLRTAAAFRAVAQGFAYPGPGQHQVVVKALAALHTPWIRGARLPVGRLRRAWEEADGAALQAEYLRLFSGRGPVSLHETAYGDGRRIAGRAAELADIAGFYAAFGLELKQSDPDLPDHIACELEFYSLLLVKQAYAQTRGHKLEHSIAQRAARRFLEQHLGRWVAPLERSIGEAGASAPYRLLGAFLDALVQAEGRRLRARPVPLPGRLPFEAMQAETFACPREPREAHRAAG
jgi:DMSO reductase family type II enzyme chaperone